MPVLRHPRGDYKGVLIHKRGEGNNTGNGYKRAGDYKRVVDCKRGGGITIQETGT